MKQEFLNKKSLVMVLLSALVLLTVLFFYLKPKQLETTNLPTAVAQQNTKVLQQVDHLTKQEISPTQNNLLPSNNNQAVSGEAALYDTKSDMKIQPIDPETDPANKVDKN